MQHKITKNKKKTKKNSPKRQNFYKIGFGVFKAQWAKIEEKYTK